MRLAAYVSRIGIILWCGLFISQGEVGANAVMDDMTYQRALRLFDRVRCPTCVAQTIKDSNTASAEEIKARIWTSLQQKKTDEEIEKELVEIYGTSILSEPSFAINTYFLWLGPFLFALIFLILGLRHIEWRTKN